MSKKTGLSGRPALDSFETVGGDLTDVVVDVADTGRDSPSERTGGSRDRVTAPHTIVGIGASAGGLAAFKELLRHLPADSGMAFVLIQHLDASHKSLLVEALASATQMPVQHVEDDSVAQPDHVYVIPPGADISMKGERFALVPRTGQKAHLHLPVDFFFTALAAERGRNAIGVVLSGSATDGTEGLRAIKSDGGITFAQEPGTTTHPSMPASAIEAGVVDHVLAIPQLAEELVRLSRDPYVAGSEPPMGARDTDRTTLARITDIVRAVVGVDFGEHKTPTFERRLARRMAVRRLHDRESYLRLLEQDIDEVRTLYEDALIHVSSFFRDPEVFAALKTKVFPEILRHKAEGAPIRVWAAGCSTGEEAYSVAMALIEFLGDQAHPHPVQIFGSDLSEIAIRTARGGRYSDGAMRGIDEERRHRYFTRLDSCYQINKNVRDLCVFVRHDLARDPPFSKLDLVSCRNVLIYFEPTLQRRVLPTFHYSLGQPGFLLLGRTEHVSGFSQLFTPTDERSKIYERSATPSTLRFSARSEKHVIPERVRAPGTKAPRGELDVSRHLDQLLLARYAPPGVLVNEELQILQFRGKTAGYLEAAQGAPQQSLARMVPAGFRSKVQAALARAKSEGAAVTVEGVELEREGSTRTCDLVVLPFAGMPENRDPLFVVLFQEAPRGSSVTARAPASPAPSPPNEPGRIARLEHELAATSEYLRTLIEEQSRTSDDLGSANEELVSGNEELQTLNEELETAKEELQSINEELTTVNDELRHRNEEVSLINSDLANLLDTVDIPIVIVDKNRRIRRFSPQAPKLLNVLPTDIGRLLDDITPNLEVADMPARIADVIAASAATSSEVQDRDGRWHRMQIRPHRAADGSVDGAIVSLLDIDAIRHHLGEAEKAKEQAERADRAKDEFLAVLSHELRTPLSVLVMQTQLLRQGGGDTAKRMRACDAIERSTKRQVDLIDDLLDVSRIVTGKMRVDLLPVDMAAVIESAIDSVAPQAASKPIQITQSLDRSMGPVRGDRVRLEQVISNLLTNAIKFTPPKGNVHVSLVEAGGLAHLTVTDDGMGIEEALLPRIFDRLMQKDSSSTRAHAGLGLGLAIVRHLIDLHGGTVGAESGGAGVGATFRITLPLLGTLPQRVPTVPSTLPPPHSRPFVGQVREPRSVDAGSLVGRRILVVEDDTGIREALTEMLTWAGAVVRAAESAAAGMMTFEEFRPDALICDIAMPGEDGYAFIGRIRSLGAGSGGETPALALTALAGDAARQRAFSEGFQMHLTKPVDIQRLTSAVTELLSH